MDTQRQSADTVKRVSVAQGGWIGGLLAIPLISLFYLGRRLWDLPFPPYDFWDWQTRVVPGNLLSLTVNGLGFQLSQLLNMPNADLGKLFEQAVALLFAVGAGAAVGAVVAWGRRQRGRDAWVMGIGAGVLRFAGTAAIEMRLGLESRPALALIWLAALYLGWGTLVGFLLDGWLLASLHAEVDRERRRGLASLLGAALGGALVIWGVGRWAGGSDASEDAERLVEDFLIPTPTAPTGEAAMNANVPVGEDGRIVPVPGTRPEVTPKGEFYRVDISTTPVDIERDAWKLALGGLFETTNSLSINDLRSYPIRTQPITLSCISNPLAGSAISTAHWSGLRLRDLLEDLGLKPEANYLHLESADGFYETVTKADMMNPQTLLVHSMNGLPLSDRHGYPLRIYIPNRYGMKQPKWIIRMTATEEDQGGYWTDRGWSKEARPHVVSVIDAIAQDAAHDGLVPVGGVAWAGDRGIQRVELQVDDGPWNEAVLRTPPLGPLSWVQWRYEWPASSGSHTLTVRATDGEGMLQIQEKSSVRPDGVTGYHSRQVTL